MRESAPHPLRAGRLQSDRVADFIPESVAGFKSESLAGLHRNQQQQPGAWSAMPARCRAQVWRLPPDHNQSRPHPAQRFLSLLSRKRPANVHRTLTDRRRARRCSAGPFRGVAIRRSAPKTKPQHRL